MRAYSRVCLLCNAAFLLMLFLRFVEIGSAEKNLSDGLLGYQPLVGTIVVLGYAAILLNIVLCAFLLLSFILKKTVAIPRWLQWSSILFLLVQVLYFFVGN